MGKLSTLMFCSILIIFIPIIEASSISKDPKSVSKWFEKLSSKKEKITKFHYYFHDIVTGKNPSAVRVAAANITDSSSNQFGSVFVIDDPLTNGPEPNAKVIGRAQGMYVICAITGNTSLMMSMNIVFTEGKYNGSTLSLLGRNPVFDKYREMSIVGGSGVFRLARGIATAKTHTFNVTSGNAVVEYHVIVLHY